MKRQASLTKIHVQHVRWQNQNSHDGLSQKTDECCDGRFGSDVFVSPIDKEHFQISVPVAISQQFYSWIFGLGNYAQITKPPEIKMEMVAKLEEIRKRYD